MKKILIINGPNLNMLGKREPETYGSLSLEDVQKYTEEKIKKVSDSVTMDWYQSNSESQIIERIHHLTNEKYDALVINPAAYSHTSVAILDALLILQIPVIEVHLSNVYRRESFRRETMLTAKASSIIMSGFGKDAYYFGVLAIIEKLNEKGNLS